MITSSRKSEQIGFQFGGHSSVTINGDDASLYIGRLDNYGEAATPRFQIWALPAAPASDLVEGVLLAEAETQILSSGYYLEYISLNADLMDSVRGPQTIVLTVSRAGQVGSYDDLVVMPDLVDFYHPQLLQPAAAKLSSDGFFASVEGISNPRSMGSQSGSLVVEFWALADADGFTGGDFHLGGVEYIAAPGGEVSAPIEFSGSPVYPAGKFYPSIVVREWSGNGYLVRDRITGSTALEFPPAGAAVADAFDAPVAVVTEVKKTEPKAELKKAEKEEPKEKKAAAPVAKKETASKVAKKVAVKKAEPKEAPKAEVKKAEPKPEAKKAAVKKVAKKEAAVKTSKKITKKTGKKK
ncbi:MAG: hypothetical protein AAFX93_11340 [Verrucomicrobiota bacterium]